MVGKILILTIVLIGFLSISSCEDNYLKEKPDYLDSCKMSDPDFTKCLPRTIQQLIQQVTKGVPNLKDFPQLEPFELDKTLINEVCNDSVTMKVELSKILVYGIGSPIVKEVKVNPKDFTFETKAVYPSMRIEGDYALNGRVKLITLNGKGRISLIFNNIDVILYAKTSLYKKGDFTFLNITNTKFDYTANGLKSHLTNLFSGNCELEDCTNGFFNKNWKILANTFKPIIQEVIADIFLDLMTRVYSFIPVNFLITDIPKST